jgi:hypothetical protein
LDKKCNYNELLIRQSPKPNFLIVDVLFNTLWVVVVVIVVVVVVVV